MSLPPYIEPGAGSLLLQYLVGLFFGAVILAWTRIKGFVSRLTGKKRTR